MADETLLDNVVWSALTGPHATFAMGDTGTALRYPPAMAPFGAVRAATPGALARLAALTDPGDPVGLVTTAPVEPFAGRAATVRATVDQMLLVEPERLDAVAAAETMRHLTADDVPDMARLAAATRPGPFGPRTIELGDYLGIRVDDALVAMGGERMKLAGFAEISAVCVDPSCRGRGYAGALMRRLALAMIARGETPFLHVVSENATAIALYERLGFRLRRRFHFAVFQAPATA